MKIEWSIDENIEERKNQLDNHIDTLRKNLIETAKEYNFDFTNPLVVSLSQKLDKEINSYHEILAIQSAGK